jgi:lipopolysaccharide/colanic/teichoic acid biosynthesis glycosyltransferase
MKSLALKRVFDIVCSLIGIIIVFPFFILIALAIVLESKGPGFYRQQRVGKDGKDFWLLKFRTMYTGSDKGLNLTVGNNDRRITRLGKILRKLKLDELPQLINVLKGDMSIVGPRPEVRKYVDMYNRQQRQILSLKPGITDYASIRYRNENELLLNAENPEDYYIREIMPKKLELNSIYMKNRSLMLDIRLVFITIYSVFVKRENKKAVSLEHELKGR